MLLRKIERKILCLSVLLISVLAPVQAETSKETASNIFQNYANVRLRYESVDQDNALKDAESLTLRAILGVKTADVDGFGMGLELEANRNILGVDNYSLPPTGFNPGVYSVIPDPETTEIDQGYVKYKSGGFSAKLGRQMITLDNQRFIGNLGFRQDRQSFDAITLGYQQDKQWSVFLSHIIKRNRIFAEDRDIDVSDTLVNASYQTGFGKLTAYAYLLEEDQENTDDNDTYGLRFVGKKAINDTDVSYQLEYAKQDVGDNLDTDYFLVDVGATFAALTAKVGFESLGSDQGRGAFSTPLATLHKFNGWTDQFLSTPNNGLQDLYFSVSGKLLSGKWAAIYHDFSADVAAPDGDDLGSEINLVYSRKVGDTVTAGIKYGQYSAGADSFAKVDTDKLWVWLSANFK